MSRTFKYTSKYGTDSELIERRKLRQGDGIEMPEYAVQPREKGVSILKRTQKQITLLSKSSKASIVFVHLVQRLEDELLKSQYSETFGTDYRWLIEEQGEHRIYSAYTRRKVAEAIQFNPQLTGEYLQKGSEPPLCLEYSGSNSNTLEPEKVEAMRIQLWSTIMSLAPPPEFIEATQFFSEYFQKIQDSIKKTKLHIDIALARPIDDIEE